jgi:hypothetical protein
MFTNGEYQEGGKTNSITLDFFSTVLRDIWQSTLQLTDDKGKNDENRQRLLPRLHTLQSWGKIIGTWDEPSFLFFWPRSREFAR